MSGASNRYPGFFAGKYQGMQGIMTLYWYQLATCGIPVAGPDPAALFPPVAWGSVRQEMEYNINRYWYARAQQPTGHFSPISTVEFVRAYAMLASAFRCSMADYRGRVDRGRAMGFASFPAQLAAAHSEGVRIRTRNSSPNFYPSRWQRAS